MAPRPHAETASDATEPTHGALHFRAHLKSQRCRENHRWSTKQTETHQHYLLLDYLTGYQAMIPYLHKVIVKVNKFLESLDSFWIILSQRSRRRDKGLYRAHSTEPRISA